MDCAFRPRFSEKIPKYRISPISFRGGKFWITKSKVAKIFASKGLDLKDLVVLSGAHTLGTAHCPSFADQFYNGTGENGAYGLVDPSLDSEYADKLRLKCKSLDDRTMLSEMDPGSFKTFDTSYYRHVAKRRGLFRSDAALLFDDTTRDYVQRIATGKFDGEFFRDFSESMIKMGDVGVLIGAEGEIRKKCYAPNLTVVTARDGACMSDTIDCSSVIYGTG